MQFLSQKNYSPKARQIPGTPVSVPAWLFPIPVIYDAFLEKPVRRPAFPGGHQRSTVIVNNIPIKLIKALISGNDPIFLIFNCLFIYRRFVNENCEDKFK